MTSLSKDLTGNTQPLSSVENTEASVQPSKPLASLEPTQNYMGITKTPSADISSADNTDNSSPTTPTTVRISEKSRQHAFLMKIALFQLQKVGLLKLFKVLSEDGKKIKEIRVVFNPDLWSESLELKVLSGSDNTDNSSPTIPTTVKQRM